MRRNRRRLDDGVRSRSYPKQRSLSPLRRSPSAHMRRATLGRYLTLATEETRAQEAYLPTPSPNGRTATRQENNEARLSSGVHWFGPGGVARSTADPSDVPNRGTDAVPAKEQQLPTLELGGTRHVMPAHRASRTWRCCIRRRELWPTMQPSPAGVITTATTTRWRIARPTSQ